MFESLLHKLMNLGVHALLWTQATFYSTDRLCNSVYAAGKRSRGGNSKASGKHVSNEISPALQKIIWNLPTCAKNHLLSRLSLCIDMPVIIRNIDATELCITKRRKGHVVGWHIWTMCPKHTPNQTRQACKR